MSQDSQKNRIWLRRYRDSVGFWRVRLYDAATGQYFGEGFRYPGEFDAALQQLNSLRSQHGESIGTTVFLDGLGEHWR